MARKTREESENTKVLILKSALDCFYEKGFSRTTFEDIALRIHLTKGAVYWHFKNKAELLAELIRQRVAKDREEIGSQYISPHSVAELREFFRREAEHIEKSPEVRKFIFFTLFQVEWSDSVFNQVQAKTGEIHDFHFKTVSALVVSIWRGLINTYVCKEVNFSLSRTFLEGFDAVIEKNQKLKG